MGDQARASVYALNKTDGGLLWRTKFDTSPGAIITNSPVMVGGRVLVGVLSIQGELAATVKDFVVTADNYAVPADVSACQAIAKNGNELDRCLPHDNHIDNLLSLNLNTSALNWSQRLTSLDS